MFQYILSSDRLLAVSSTIATPEHDSSRGNCIPNMDTCYVRNIRTKKVCRNSLLHTLHITLRYLMWMKHTVIAHSLHGLFLILSSLIRILILLVINYLPSNRLNFYRRILCPVACRLIFAAVVFILLTARVNYAIRPF